ncbi:MAG TPA: hypothetical protein VFB21_20760 [Chthonomonadaceae bacterium]|nr:hypothetical protein [Chthonomonadaceae bacterium]
MMTTLLACFLLAGVAAILQDEGGATEQRAAGGGGAAKPDANLPTVRLRDAPTLRFRGAGGPEASYAGETDCNSPAHWDGDTLFIFNSAGHPWRSSGPDLFHQDQSHQAVQFDNQVNGGRWFESTYRDEDGTLYGWYHNEPGGVCPDRADARHLTAPRIGCARSTDNGATWHDLGFVMEAPPNSLHCAETKNHYFAGGNGDFSVLLDAKKEFFYFFISTYGDFAEQGVSVARMRCADRANPVGKVWKWHKGKWEEPGLGGHLTPIFPAKVDWHREDADAFWGPSIHWNHHLQQYVILLNRAKDKDWAQEGIYVTFNRDIANPNGWSPPQKLALPESALGWYPQVMGLDRAQRETDKLAGRVARLFIRGESRWEILFLKPGEPPE